MPIWGIVGYWPMPMPGPNWLMPMPMRENKSPHPHPQGAAAGLLQIGPHAGGRGWYAPGSYAGIGVLRTRVDRPQRTGRRVK